MNHCHTSQPSTHHSVDNAGRGCRSNYIESVVLESVNKEVLKKEKKKLAIRLQQLILTLLLLAQKC